MESVTETTTILIVDDVMRLLENIETGVSIQTHMMYLFLAIIFAWGLYQIYVSFFKPFI